MLRHLRAVASQKTDCQVPSILEVARKMVLTSPAAEPEPVATPARKHSIAKDNNGVIDFDDLDLDESSRESEFRNLKLRIFMLPSCVSVCVRIYMLL
jgi:hypothetical protein